VARLDSLPPDQRAVLQLVLRQRRTYDDLAGLLKIPGEAVRQRALLAAESLVPPPNEVTVEDGEDVVDYLLGQPGADIGQVSASGRRWGRDLRRELDPIAPEGLPEIPDPQRRRRDAPAAAAPAAQRDEVEDDGRADVDAPPPATPDTADEDSDDAGGRSSRLGGALLLVGLGIFVAALLILLINGGGDDERASSGAGNTTSTPTAASSADAGASASAGAGNLNGFRVRTQVNLAPQGGGDALAIAQLVSRGEESGFAVTAQGLSERPGTYHALWLTGGPKPTILAAVTNDQIAKGRFTGLTRVPKDLKSYDRMQITRERITRSKRPPANPSSDVILAGTLKVPADFNQ
jgi:Sigma-70, region 4